MSEFVIKDGYIWPTKDEYCYKAATSQVNDLHVAMQYCKKKDIVIQAGGNCGVWPKELSRHFKWVYTFEPDSDNFHCLTRNAPESNIIKMQAILGYERSPVGMNACPTNIGAHSVKGKGIIPQIRIDDLNLPGCDLIQLDIEGYEALALRGAAYTLEAFSPVLMLEMKGHGERYGITEEQTLAHLDKHYGYKVKKQIGRDVILIRK